MAESDHRGGFGEFGGESGGLIERAFREKIVLVGLTRADDTDQDTEASLDELALLVDTAGADAVERVVQRRPAPDPATFIGKGKAEELRSVAEACMVITGSANGGRALAAPPCAPPRPFRPARE